MDTTDKTDYAYRIEAFIEALRAREERGDTLRPEDRTELGAFYAALDELGAFYAALGEFEAAYLGSAMKRLRREDEATEARLRPMEDVLAFVQHRRVEVQALTAGGAHRAIYDYFNYLNGYAYGYPYYGYFDVQGPDDIRLRGTRVGVETILLGYLDEKQTAEQIAAQHPSLSLEQVYATILLYLRERERMDAYLEHFKVQSRVRQEVQDRNPPAVAQRLRALQQVGTREVRPSGA